MVPTYNEATNIEALLRAVRAALPDAGILVVDDGSPDGTADLVEKAATELGDVHVLRRAEKSGLGSAYRAGFRWGLAAGYDACVEMDADFSHDPAALPALVAPLEDGYEVVVGSRYVPGGRLDERWSWWRRFLSWWANEVWSRLILGLRTRDITAGFKCWRRDTLLGIGLERVKSNGYAFQVEMTYLSERLGYRIKEIPIYFEDRRIGQSKMSVPVKLQGALDVIRIWWRHRDVKRDE